MTQSTLVRPDSLLLQQPPDIRQIEVTKGPLTVDPYQEHDKDKGLNRLATEVLNGILEDCYENGKSRRGHLLTRRSDRDHSWRRRYKFLQIVRKRLYRAIASGELGFWFTVLEMDRVAGRQFLREVLRGEHQKEVTAHLEEYRMSLKRQKIADGDKRSDKRNGKG